MKKVISLILALTTCLSLCACGEKLEPDAAAAVAGAYWCAGGDGCDFTLNEDFTYDGMDYYGIGKGTWEAYKSKIILKHKNSDEKVTTLVKYGDFYCIESYFQQWTNEYGVPVTFSADGYIDYEMYEVSYVYGQRRHKSIHFRDDGTLLYVSWCETFDENTLRSNEFAHYESEGTYSLKDGVITIEYKGGTNYWLYKDGKVCKKVWKKYEDYELEILETVPIE